ncbi:PREDICTED: hypoxia-inducible factor 1-alpha-like isoform X2 [Nicrophorus vespilloides]|uniref:Hypoxia-inducible factor 1-alpha-like isoform X2 n=1 Tax=Nicrophorus vespilloides TaxID=110193 RepID=A0ABM1MVV1_NICVS|nr:PREDICTED: hypoxia-inducible factor 1-alpha-like isoform X2 [Nicrophorus vespilloides]
MCLVIHERDLGSDKKGKVQNHKRNNEKRKEKCRDAARCRRSRETEIFTDLSNALPLSEDKVSQLDKASVMRLAIAYLKVRDMIKLVPEPKMVKDETEASCSEESLVLKSLDGFAVALSDEGDFIYVSENVYSFLGISQVDLMGQNVYDYCHPCDHDEIKDILSAKSQQVGETSKSFFLRLKCTLTSKGRSVNLKSATYKVIHFTGHMLQEVDDSKESAEGCSSSNSSNNTTANDGSFKKCLVAIGQPIQHPSNIEAPLPSQTFLTKHNMNMTFTYADEKMLEFLGYNPEDLIGKSIYSYSHALDSEVITSAYKCLFSKGQTETSRYRFLAKTGGYAWVLTQATLIYDKNQKPQSVVCVNYVISEIECKDEIYAEFQLASASIASTPEPPTDVKTETTISVPQNINDIVDTAELVVPEVIEEEQQTLPSSNTEKPESTTERLFHNIGNYLEEIRGSSQSPRPLTATSKIFAPRTKEMSKGYITFSDEEPGITMLKDEPEDLTYLAPEAGEVVSLGDRLFSETFLNLVNMKDSKDDNTEQIGSMPSEDTNLFDGFFDSYSAIIGDPFIYKNEGLSQLLSPDRIVKSSDCSMQSLNSPTDSFSDEDQMSSFVTLMEEDMDMKAPYIPMTMGEDLPLVLTNDLMWSSNVERPARNTDPPKTTSSLAQLLSSGVNNKRPIRSNDHGGTIIQNNTSATTGSSFNDYYDKGQVNWDLSKVVASTGMQSHKRLNSTSFESTSNKRTKCEPKSGMTSELLQQLMSNNTHSGNRSRVASKGKSNWLLDSGGPKAACVSQPSESVLMNLLEMSSSPQNLKADRLISDRELEDFLRAQQLKLAARIGEPQRSDGGGKRILRRGISLLSTDGIPSLFDLTQQDYEVNAPVNNFLLQGDDLLQALDATGNI